MIQTIECYEYYQKIG